MANQQEMDMKKEGLISLLVFFALTIACIVFAILCIYGSSIAFFMQNELLFSIVASLLLCAVCGLCVWFVVTGKQTIFKAFFSVYVLILFALVVCFILQKTGFFKVIKDAESLQEYLENAGAWMPILYIVLQYLQVIILPIPSTVSTVAGVALFGPFQTLLYSVIGIMLGSMTGFLIGRKLGGKAVAWMVGKETLDKWQKKLKGRDNLFLTVMFLMPFFPDDVLCFIAGLSSMSIGYFFVMVLISRILAISVTCYSIDIIPLNTWWGLLIWAGIILVMIVVFMILYKNMDRLQNFLGKRFKTFRKKKK